jgi:hypothetical protein
MIFYFICYCSEYAGICCYIAYIANCSINGYIYVIMNERIRKKVI